MSDVKDLGLLATTTVVRLGEFGRTPGSVLTASPHFALSRDATVLGVSQGRCGETIRPQPFGRRPVGGPEDLDADSISAAEAAG